MKNSESPSTSTEPSESKLPTLIDAGMDPANADGEMNGLKVIAFRTMVEDNTGGSNTRTLIKAVLRHLEGVLPPALKRRFRFGSTESSGAVDQAVASSIRKSVSSALERMHHWQDIENMTEGINGLITEGKKLHQAVLAVSPSGGPVMNQIINAVELNSEDERMLRDVFRFVEDDEKLKEAV